MSARGGHDVVTDMGYGNEAQLASLSHDVIPVASDSCNLIAALSW